MRLIARLPDERQATALITSLKESGLDRGDMIVNNLADDQGFVTKEDAEKGVVSIKTERDGMNAIVPSIEKINGLKGDTGIVVAVDIPKNSADKIREIMEQNGAVEIIHG